MLSSTFQLPTISSSPLSLLHTSLQPHPFFNSAMNSNFHKLLIILLVFSTATASARKMASTKAAGEVDQQIKGKESNSKVASVDSFDKLMGVEECGNGETECLMRRAVSEAHLDYIYTEKKGN